MPITIGGKQYTVPGVYGTVEVVNAGNVALPSFNNLLLIGSAKKGIPYNAEGKKGYEVIKGFSSVGDAKAYYGNTDLAQAMSYAQKGGAGVVFMVNVANLTLASATIKDNQATPVESFDIAPQEEFYGASGNDIAISIVTADSKTTVSITPPKMIKFLTSNASTTSPDIYLDDVSGLYAGMTLNLVDNANALEQVTVSSVDAENKKITLTSAPTSAFSQSNYARMFVENTGAAEVKTFESTATVSDLISWINSGSILTANRRAYTGNFPTSLTKTYLQDIAGATKGVSPDATDVADGDFDLFAESAFAKIEEFENYTGVRLRIFNVLTSSDAVHSVYAGLAVNMRNKQYSIQVVTGAAKGDVDLPESNSLHPIQRAKALNSGDVIFAGMGIDDKAAYISLAPMAAGIMSGNSVKHNMTGDAISAISVEKFFGESNNETEIRKYLKAGCLIVGTGKSGYYLVQGVNTFQNQDMVWNEDADTTYLIQQRQIVDYVFEGYKLQMNQGVGEDGYGVDSARAQGNGILTKYLDDGYIADFVMLKAWSEGNAVYTKPQITPIDATDFVGFELKVLIKN